MTISFDGGRECNACHGTGRTEDCISMQPCDVCHGTGWIEAEYCDLCGGDDPSCNFGHRHPPPPSLRRSRAEAAAIDEENSQ